MSLEEALDQLARQGDLNLAFARRQEAARILSELVVSTWEEASEVVERWSIAQVRYALSREGALLQLRNDLAHFLWQRGQEVRTELTNWLNRV